MSSKLMILPAHDYDTIRLVKIPDDYEDHEVFRHVTGIIAEVEENDSEYTWDDVLAALEDRGFENIEFILGPALD